MKTQQSKFTVRNQSGQGLTEYIALVMMIAVAAIGVTHTFGKSVKGKIEEARKQIDTINYK